MHSFKSFETHFSPPFDVSRWLQQQTNSTCVQLLQPKVKQSTFTQIFGNYHRLPYDLERTYQCVVTQSKYHPSTPSKKLSHVPLILKQRVIYLMSGLLLNIHLPSGILTSKKIFISWKWYKEELPDLYIIIITVLIVSQVCYNLYTGLLWK